MRSGSNGSSNGGRNSKILIIHLSISNKRNVGNKQGSAPRFYFDRTLHGCPGILPPREVTAVIFYNTFDARSPSIGVVLLFLNLFSKHAFLLDVPGRDSQKDRSNHEDCCLLRKSSDRIRIDSSKLNFKIMSQYPPTSPPSSPKFQFVCPKYRR